MLCLVYQRMNRVGLVGKRGESVPEDGFAYFSAKMDLEALDEKLKRFIMLRNELVMLAKEIGFEVSSGLLELKVK